MREDSTSRVEARPAVMPYARFLAYGLATVAALVAVGYLPTRNLGGESAIPAMLAGCGLAFAASLAGTVPLLLARGRRPQERIPPLLGSMALRLTAAIGLAVAAALSGLFTVVPLLVWLLLAHLGLLAADTHYALSHVKAPGSGRPPAPSLVEPVLEKR